MKKLFFLLLFVATVSISTAQQFINIDSVPLLSEQPDETIIILQGDNGNFYRTTKSELLPAPSPLPSILTVEAINFQSQSGFVTLRSPNVNTGGFNIFLPAEPNHPNDNQPPHANIGNTDLIFHSETAPNFTDIPNGKTSIIWQKTSTGERWLCTTINTTQVAKIKFE